MKKCIVIPDSFKGTLSSTEICAVMKKQILSRWPEAEVITIPVADGGEGTVDCFLEALSGRRIQVAAHGPFGEPCVGDCAQFGDKGVVEMAAFAGLPMAEGRLNPGTASTYGVGEAIRKLVEMGCKEILLGLGGSCTNDGGTGMAAALGVKFYDADGKVFVPSGATLSRIAHIDISEAERFLSGIAVTAMCDIDNPLYGKEGAAYVFAPQKGADEQMVELLDAGLRHLSDVIQSDLHMDVSGLPGSGAAGGMGAGVSAFLGGRLQPGIQAVLDMVQFDRMLEGADLVFTGEGRIDSQSLRGKVVIGVAGRAARKRVPVIAVVGSIGDGAAGAYDLGVTALFSINRRAEDFSVSRYRARENLAETMEDLCRFYAAAEAGRAGGLVYDGFPERGVREGWLRRK